MSNRRVIAALVAALALWACHAAVVRDGWADDDVPASIRLLESKHELIRNNLNELALKRAQANEDVRRLGAEIDRIQSQGEPSFLERRRLERLQAESLEAGRRMEDLTAQLERKRREFEESRDNLYRVYTSEMEKAAEALSGKVSRARMIELTRLFIRLRDRRAAYQPPSPAVGEADFLGVTYSADESLSSLTTKRDLLIKRLDRLRSTMAAIRGEIESLKNDKALADQMRNLVIQEQLFEDGVVFSPGPRQSPTRSDGSEGGTDAPSSSDSASGVHISPIEGLGTEPATDDVSLSIDDEIRRLEKLVAYLTNVERTLNRQIEEIRRLIREAENRRPTISREAAPPPEKGSNP